MLDQTELDKHYSIRSVLLFLGWPSNGKHAQKLKQLIKELNLSVSHFGKKPIEKKWNEVSKECPVCRKEFLTLENHPREKTVCSHGCANTFFRSGSDHPNWNDDRQTVRKSTTVYRRICFSYYPFECLVCGENKVVEVHHLDKNHENNKIENLVPLCPTHHDYMHFGYGELIQPIIDERKYKGSTLRN